MKLLFMILASVCWSGSTNIDDIFNCLAHTYDSEDVSTDTFNRKNSNKAKDPLLVTHPSDSGDMVRFIDFLSVYMLFVVLLFLLIVSF